jgi:hypothetical protein
MMDDGWNDSRSEMELPRAVGWADVCLYGKGDSSVVNAVKCGLLQQ